MPWPSVHLLPGLKFRGVSGVQARVNVFPDHNSRCCTHTSNLQTTTCTQLTCYLSQTITNLALASRIQSGVPLPRAVESLGQKTLTQYIATHTHGFLGCYEGCGCFFYWAPPALCPGCAGDRRRLEEAGHEKRRYRERARLCDRRPNAARRRAVLRLKCVACAKSSNSLTCTAVEA